MGFIMSANVLKKYIEEPDIVNSLYRRSWL